MLSDFLFISLGFALGYIARQGIVNANNNLKISEVGAQLRADFSRNVTSDADFYNDQEPFDGIEPIRTSANELHSSADPGLR